MATQTLIESTRRIVHQSHSGMEIIREFNVEPYAHHIAVLKHLQGFIKDGERVPPARDPWIDVCYCTEARAEQWHEDQLTTSESLEVISRQTVNGEQKVQRIAAFDDKRIPKLLQMNRENPKVGTAGAKVTATYRPLITAWDEDPGPSGTERWDWLDPTVTPGVRQIQWPNGLFITAEVAGVQATHNVPDTVASPLGITIADVSIRRILVPKIPWNTIKGLANAVNAFKWPPDDHPALSILPQFEAKTLRFVGPDIRNMMDSEGNKWFEITLNFQWINHIAPLLYTINGFERTDEPVTWNHVFLNPSVFFLKGKTAWYEVFRGADPGEGAMRPPFEIPGAALKAGFLYNSANMDPLFRLSSK